MKILRIQIALYVFFCGMIFAQENAGGASRPGGEESSNISSQGRPELKAIEDEDFKLLESLKLNSPFGRLTAGPNGNGASPEEQQVSNVKLQGIAYINGKWLFSIADVKQKRSEWAQLGETKLGCMVQSYDPNTGILGVSIDGKNYPITLKERDSLKDAAPPPPTQGGPPRHGPRGGFRSLSPEKRKEFLQNAIKNIDREIAAKKRNAEANKKR